MKYFVTRTTRDNRSEPIAWDCHWDPRDNFPWTVEGEIAWLLRREIYGQTVHVTKT